MAPQRQAPGFTPTTRHLWLAALGLLVLARRRLWREAPRKPVGPGR